MQESAHIASVENPALVKQRLASREIGEEWHQRDIWELELQQKKERGWQKEGPELRFKKERGRSDDGRERAVADGRIRD
jgi:hypothetical protein